MMTESSNAVIVSSARPPNFSTKTQPYLNVQVENLVCHRKQHPGRTEKLGANLTDTLTAKGNVANRPFA